jgi:hypothetical protein
MTYLQSAGRRLGRRNIFARVRDVPAFHERKNPVHTRYEYEGNQ